MTLQNITLSGLIIEADVSHTGVRSDVAKTLSGGLVIWETTEPSGRLITLKGGADFGWMTREDLQSLQALASIPGARYKLTTEEEEITVRFRNEAAPAIEAIPIVGRENQSGDDYYHNISIKLMEV